MISLPKTAKHSLGKNAPKTPNYVATTSKNAMDLFMYGCTQIHQSNPTSR